MPRRAGPTREAEARPPFRPPASATAVDSDADSDAVQPQANPLRRVLGWSSLDLARELRSGGVVLALEESVPQGAIAEPEPR